MEVVLDNIRSMHNVGSIFRTSDAAGVSKLYLSGITPIPLDRFKKSRPQITKVSLGAEQTVAWEQVSNTALLLDELKSRGYQILALEQAVASVPYISFHKQDLTEPIVLILGSEVGGLSQDILKKCDRILEIPMQGTKESLNVAVAFGILIFHLLS
ncbi:MAG: RNA methyltransferase [Candidatus Harrisonbacteria bacterium CG10_big_fil_rev_8_21_14_0_10_42_17]|uniref:RNA methyltransferase n=1 Tax=Candidatus Harrisonbacteria bacterium CG10_big_fil_rev_8_21_14_0_10_42_17 TaxID=1974584 RepID=A0A2M6WIR4_9BACT|nr:MAG: RNA methyltransferase [Candidatus Harrisonbacteria bacterium CG10_big_fil_rev_8_21_14_0_10_42_17]